MHPITPILHDREELSTPRTASRAKAAEATAVGRPRSCWRTRWAGESRLARSAAGGRAERAPGSDALGRGALTGAPVQHLLGEWDFYGRPFTRGPARARARGPRPRSSVEAALREAPHARGACSISEPASGILAITYLLEASRVAGVRSRRLGRSAWPWRATNAGRHGVLRRLALAASDWLSAARTRAARPRAVESALPRLSEQRRAPADGPRARSARALFAGRGCPGRDPPSLERAAAASSRRALSSSSRSATASPRRSRRRSATAAAGASSGSIPTSNGIPRIAVARARADLDVARHRIPHRGSGSRSRGRSRLDGRGRRLPARRTRPSPAWRRRSLTRRAGPCFPTFRTFADIRTMQKLLATSASSCRRGPARPRSRRARSHAADAPYDLVKTMRGLRPRARAAAGAKRARARLRCPGGCAIGVRPIDLHLAAFRQLGAEVTARARVRRGEGRQAHGREIAFETRHGDRHGERDARGDARPGHDASSRTPPGSRRSSTWRGCCARWEPGSGRRDGHDHDRGRRALHGAVARGRRPTGSRRAPTPWRPRSTRGDVTVRRCRPEHLEALDGEPRRRRSAGRDRRRLPASPRGGPLSGADVATAPYPGFPTDLQAQWMALATTAWTGSRRSPRPSSRTASSTWRSWPGWGRGSRLEGAARAASRARPG